MTELQQQNNSQRKNFEILQDKEFCKNISDSTKLMKLQQKSLLIKNSFHSNQYFLSRTN